MKDLMSMICLNFMRRGEGALYYLVQTLLLWAVSHSKQFDVFGGQEKNVSNKENCSGPPVTL